MTKAEQAVHNFQNGYNCAQAVLTAYAEDFNLDKNTALSLATGFGAGVGRHQGMCGAVSAAIMVLGLKFGSRPGDGREKINATYVLVRRFMEEFTTQKGSIICKELLSGCNLSTEEGQKVFHTNNLRARCSNFVEEACVILDKMLAENSASEVSATK
jgi:C_GCAxxG_C_C family probable redox protein